MKERRTELKNRSKGRIKGINVEQEQKERRTELKYEGAKTG